MLPFLPSGVIKAGVVIKHGDTALRVSADTIRKLASKIPTPSPKIQKWAQKGGFIDPRTNAWIKFSGTLAADHVYPKSLIMELKDFDKLHPSQQEWLLNYPGNFESLPTSWNSSKFNRLADDWANTPMGSTASKEYIDALRARQQGFEAFANEMIGFWLGL
jgi:hypothetical protein